MAEEYCTLDHIDNISVCVDNHINRINVLRSLLIGMYHLATFTRRRELDMLEKQDEDTVQGLFQVTDETLMLGCVFDWFSISLVSYLRMVKLIDLMELNSWELMDIQETGNKKQIKKHCLKYIETVAPAVYKWRNKIAAHRVATDPRNDTLNLLNYSTMPTVDYTTPYYGVLNFRVFMSNGGDLGLDPWQLTKTFEDLAPRFWPEVKLTPLPY